MTSWGTPWESSGVQHNARKGRKVKVHYFPDLALLLIGIMDFWSKKDLS